MTYERLSENPENTTGPCISKKRSKKFRWCMNSKRRSTSQRASSNRHRKSQPFRYT
ncbi:uncharacterized protein [Drosophila bipectinata]|uniref:uncharacterized protein n=1 Tax=Drosophila bipectinata TaxID=42026 RepID=UPI001C8B0368|nr:uncharacterized protein LOC122321391 [Drosophila bipectinata]